MSKTVFITRRESFAAAHRLFKPELTDEENFNLFGKCSNPNWHGHNYILEVVVKGMVDTSTGFVVDVKKLKAIMPPRLGLFSEGHGQDRPSRRGDGDRRPL